MSKAIIVPDLAYTSPKGRRGNGSTGRKEMLAKLRYFQYRDDANGHIPQERGLERWRDHGLGRNYRDILNRCDALSSGSVLAWTWVISPSPDLMQFVPEQAREALVMAMTEQIVESYYEARGMDCPEYAFVLHDRLTNDTKHGSEPLHQLHTHVVLPGTVPTVTGERVPFYNRSNKGHIDLLREIATETFSAELDRLVGPEWHALRPEIVTEELVPPELPELPPVDARTIADLDRATGQRAWDRDIL